jgi:hypothetical protein
MVVLYQSVGYAGQLVLRLVSSSLSPLSRQRVRPIRNTYLYYWDQESMIPQQTADIAGQSLLAIKTGERKNNK